MRKTYLAIGGSIILFIVIIMMIVLSLFSHTRNNTGTGTPGVTITPVNTANLPLLVESVNPANNVKNVSVNQPISVYFNRVFSPSEISVLTYPQIHGSTSIANTQFTLTPTLPLAYNIVYKISVLDAKGNIIYQSTFSTGTQPVVPFSNDNSNTGQQADKNLLQSDPATYLSNNTPYSTKDFSVTSYFNNTPQGHFAFTVTLSNPNGKGLFVNWMHSLGLTDTQIQTLDITYQ